MDNKTTGLATLDERNLALASDYSRQRKLFAKFGYPDPGPFLMGHNAIVETGDGKYKMVARRHPVDFAVDLDGKMRCVAQVQRTKAERLGGMRIESHPDRRTARALVDNLLCQSVEVGEVVPWGAD